MRALIIVCCLAALAACAAPPATAPAAPLPTAALASPTATSAPPTAAPAPTASPAPTATQAPPTATPLPAYDLVLQGGTLIDGTGAPPLPDAAVAIRDGRIAAVGQAADLVYGPDTPVRDLAGATIMPGFINTHVHTVGLSDEEMRAWARAGVTTVRDLGGPTAFMLAQRDAIASGRLPGLPRLLVAGPLVTVPDSFSVHLPAEEAWLLLVDSPAEAREKINALIDSGVDLIKIVTSGRTDTHFAELTEDEIAAISEVAHARGLRVSAHVDRAVSMRRAVLNGADDIAHSPRDRLPDDLIQLMVERGVALTPTIDVYEALAEGRGIGDDWRRYTAPIMYDNLRRFAAAGGLLAFGDDYGGVPDMALGMPIEEARHWLRAGIDPLALIVAATKGGAIVCGLEDQIGTLEIGKRADILVVDGDPLEDIAALTRPLLVLRDGAAVE